MTVLNLRSTASRYLVTAAFMASTSLVGACSGTADERSNSTGTSVASIPRTGSAVTGVRTTAAALERPLVRLDASPEEVEQLFKQYEKCLSEHGMPEKSAYLRDEGKGKVAAEKASTACAALQPEEVSEREKRLDPAAFKDDQRAQVKCMREHGLAIETDAEGWGYTNPARDMGSVWDKKCERLAFGD